MTGGEKVEEAEGGDDAESWEIVPKKRDAIPFPCFFFLSLHLVLEPHWPAPNLFPLHHICMD